MGNTINFTEATQGMVTRFEIVASNHNPGKCGHGNLALIVEERIVKCKHCGAILDPFDALLQVADKERRFIWEVSRAKAAIEEWEKIQAEWTPTQRERRRVEKVRQWAKKVEIDSND